MSFFRKFGRNNIGRDFVVGDVHGCFGLLRTALHKANFNEATDRLFSVGDLVDRGPASAEAVTWLELPWFHAVRGNHEQINVNADLGQVDVGLHLVNGGKWFYDLSAEEQHRTALEFAKLPLAIEVDTPNGMFGIVHAEPVGLDWGTFTKSLDVIDTATSETCLWSRERFRTRDSSKVEGIDRVYVGHTPVKERHILGNIHYIDTGAVFGHKLTLICMTNDTEIQVFT